MEINLNASAYTDSGGNVRPIYDNARKEIKGSASTKVVGVLLILGGILFGYYFSSWWSFLIGGCVAFIGWGGMKTGSGSSEIGLGFGFVWDCIGSQVDQPQMYEMAFDYIVQKINSLPNAGVRFSYDIMMKSYTEFRMLNNSTFSGKNDEVYVSINLGLDRAFDAMDMRAAQVGLPPLPRMF